MTERLFACPQSAFIESQVDVYIPYSQYDSINIIYSQNVIKLQNHFFAFIAKLEADDEVQDFKETVCRWDSCSEQYRLHEDLVKVYCCLVVIHPGSFLIVKVWKEYR